MWKESRLSKTLWSKTSRTPVNSCKIIESSWYSTCISQSPLYFCIKTTFGTYKWSSRPLLKDQKVVFYKRKRAYWTSETGAIEMAIVNSSFGWCHLRRNESPMMARVSIRIGIVWTVHLLLKMPRNFSLLWLCRLCRCTGPMLSWVFTCSPLR